MRVRVRVRVRMRVRVRARAHRGVTAPRACWARTSAGLRQRHEQRQKRRDEVLETTEANFRDFGARLQKLNEAKPSIVVIGSAKAVEEANEKGAGLKVVNVL